MFLLDFCLASAFKMDKALAAQNNNDLSAISRAGTRRRNGRNGKKKILNPTMAELRAAVKGRGNRAEYRSTTRTRNEKVDDPVFKLSARLTTALYQVFLFATNKTSESMGDSVDMKSLKSIKDSKVQHWPTLDFNMVGVVYRPHNAVDDSQTRYYVTCFMGWLNAFVHLEKMLDQMEVVADNVAYGWNLLNSEARMAGNRVKNEIAVLIDVREKKNSTNTTELILCGNSYDWNNYAQNQAKSINMSANDVKFQLFLQDGDKKDPKKYKNQMSFTLQEWREIVTSPEFEEFYDNLWNFAPLPQTYADRIETYIQETEGPEFHSCDDITVPVSSE